MRKISTFCRFDGSFCLAFFACFLLFALRPGGVYAQIILPDRPVEQTPPQGPRQDQRLIESRDQRRQTEETERKKIKDEMSEVESQKAKEAFLRDRRFNGFTDLSLTIGKAVVSGGRSNYHLDPGVHLSSYVRSIWRDEPRDLQGWFGLRVSPFAGYGTQKGLTARFAHTWIGPAVGLGKITFEDDRSGPASTSYLALFSGGLAALTRLSGAPDQGANIGEDFKASPWSMDGGGAWFEFRWYQINMGAVGFGGVGGAQFGTGKAYMYAGISAAGLF